MHFIEGEGLTMRIKSLVDYAKQYIESGIVKGSFHPGQQIKEQQIASHLGFSRPPIREAFKILETEGLITRKPNRGVFVSEIDGKDIWEIYTLKMALYSLAARLAIEKISDRGIRRLEREVEKMEECVRKHPPDLIKYQTLNEKFHNMTIEIAGHERLKRIAAGLQNQVKRLSYKSLADRSHLLSSCRYHRQILEAMKRKDEDATERLNREHILRGLHVLQRLFRAEEESIPRVNGPSREMRAATRG
jgi:DNA-binding GntR family transcriptional regulator